jgi:hypothetical protein
MGQAAPAHRRAIVRALVKEPGLLLADDRLSIRQDTRA